MDDLYQCYKVVNKNMNLNGNICKRRSKHCLLCGIVSGDTSVHKFPKALDLRSKWAQFCNVDINSINTNSLLCFAHFSSDSYMESANRKKLKADAVPTTSIQNEHEYAKLQPEGNKQKYDESRVLNEENTDMSMICHSNESAKLYYRSCILCGGSTDRRLTYHRFPKNNEFRLLWADFCGMHIAHVKDGYRLCSKHFTIDCFDESQRLIKNSVPTITIVENVEFEEDIYITECADTLITSSPIKLLAVTDLADAGNICKEMCIEIDKCSIPSNDHCNGPTIENDTSKIPSRPQPTSTYVDISNTLQATTSNEKPMKKKPIRYVGDLTNEDIQNATPELLRKYLKTAKQTLSTKNLIIRSTRARLRRMNAKLTTLENLIPQLHDKNLMNREVVTRLETETALDDLYLEDSEISADLQNSKQQSLQKSLSSMDSPTSNITLSDIESYIPAQFERNNKRKRKRHTNKLVQHRTKESDLVLPLVEAVEALKSISNSHKCRTEIHDFSQSVLTQLQKLPEEHQILCMRDIQNMITQRRLKYLEERNSEQTVTSHRNFISVD